MRLIMSGSVRVTLGPTYQPNLWDLRKRISAARTAGEPLVFVTVSAPITSDVIEVAIESGSLYLIGVRAVQGTWLEFAPDTVASSPLPSGDPRPRLPGSRWIMVGPLKALSSYRGLQLSWNISEKPGAIGEVTYAHQPAALLRFIRHWDGKITGYDVRLSLWVLIFVLCESLRFRSIENTCARWIRPIGGTSPDHAGWPVLTITKAMLDTVQNWHTRARGGDSDIWTWPPEMPDAIIS
jgi:hypothetical protein